MKKFLIQAWSTYKGVFYWANAPAFISNVFVRPAIQVIMYAMLGKFAVGVGQAQMLALGFSVQWMQAILIGGLGWCYSNEFYSRTLPFFYISPVNRFINYISRSVFHYPNALLSFISSIFVAWLIIGMNFSMVNWFGFVLAILVIAAATTAFAQLIGMYALAFKEWQPIYGLSGGILGLMTGCIIPISVFPGPIQEIAKLLPITNGLFAVRAAFSGAPMSDIYGYILREAATGIIYLLIAFIAFLYIEQWAKRTGALDVET